MIESKKKHLEKLDPKWTKNKNRYLINNCPSVKYEQDDILFEKKYFPYVANLVNDLLNMDHFKKKDSTLHLLPAGVYINPWDNLDKMPCMEVIQQNKKMSIILRKRYLNRASLFIYQANNELNPNDFMTQRTYNRFSLYCSAKAKQYQWHYERWAIIHARLYSAQRRQLFQIWRRMKLYDGVKVRRSGRIANQKDYPIILVEQLPQKRPLRLNCCVYFQLSKLKEFGESQQKRVLEVEKARRKKQQEFLDTVYKSMN